MNTETNTQPLYKVLNEQRTQGEVNATTETYLGFYELKFKDGGTLCTVPKVNDNDRYFSNAEYTALAVNNLASVADALAELYALAYQWANDKEDETLVKAKEALKRIS